LNIPVTTEAITIIDMNGQKSQPIKNVEARKMARKNHRIISLGVLFCIAPPVPLTQGGGRGAITIVG